MSKKNNRKNLPLNATPSGFAKDIDYKINLLDKKKFKLRYMHADYQGIDWKNPSDPPIRFQGLVPPQVITRYQTS